MEHLCDPLEDFEYNVFGHDRMWIRSIELILLILFWLFIWRQPTSPTSLCMSTVASGLTLLLPVQAIKTYYTFWHPIDAIQSTLLCHILRIEYTLHYFCSTVFQQSFVLFYALIAWNRSVYSEVGKKARIAYGLVFIESAIISILYVNLRSHAVFLLIFLLQQLFFLGALSALILLVGCLTCTKAPSTKENNQHGYNFFWLQIYLNSPFWLNFYQIGIMTSLLFPLLSPAPSSFDYPLDLSLRAIEANLVHKFTFTTIVTIGPIFILPPFRREILKLCCFSRRNRISTPAESPAPTSF
ncbi:unnamed protein product [Caenorhabditis auriculariae]|uniref:Uncharacterized protein n=1 Tax=Caenorhabditis auriculariae TaxID=2777116 RepID=A0A8S1HNP1_9PELO|nr:unnamed protein product [Caenorhabditis auriculariae]